MAGGDCLAPERLSHCRTRFQNQAREIDIIARKGDLVAIIEVKARRDVARAIDAVGYEAQRRITNAADIWLSKHVITTGYR